MSTAIWPPAAPKEWSWDVPRKRFTRSEVERIIDTGVFDGQRFELIDGDLIDKMGQKPPHSFTIRLIADWLVKLFGIERVQIQLPIEASSADRDRSVPEPDIAVLIQRKAEYGRRDPRGNELSLVVEVASTSQSFDLTVKACLYARSAVSEYWVMDVEHRALIVHREPDGQQYRQIRVYTEDELVSMEGREERVRVGDLLPDRE
jgi:Uma2 family endonuclease